jgi:hypothetical protein
MEINNLTKNPVENWFDQLKESLSLFLPVIPSQFANFMFNQLEAVYELNPAFQNMDFTNFGKESRE